MLSDLGLLDSTKKQWLTLLNEEPRYETSVIPNPNKHYFVAAVETSPGIYYLHGCINQAEIEEAKRCYHDIVWYNQWSGEARPKETKS